jgi:hypothetical protein
MNRKVNVPHSTSKQAAAPAFVRPVQKAVSQAGHSLDQQARHELESRFQHDFSEVRVHSDPTAAQAAQAVQAHALTVGEHIIFNQGRYQPHDPGGRQLLAHELAHVVQQRMSPGGFGVEHAEAEAREAAGLVLRDENPLVSTGVDAGVIQRDNGTDDEEERRFQLRMPELGESLGYQRPRLSLLDPEHQLRLDPEQQVQLVQSLLSVESLLQAAERIGSEPSLGAAPAPDLSPRAAAQAGQAAQPSSMQRGPFSAPQLPQRPPLVPPGRGPATARPGTTGDIVKAILRVPVVQTGVQRLQDEAGRQVRQGWESMTPGERALLITHSVVLGGTALTGIALNPEARQFALEQIQGRDIPLPRIPVTMRFNLTGPNQQIFFRVNVGQLLPPSFGFR